MHYLKYPLTACVVAFFCLASTNGIAEEGLANCAEQFPGGVIANAPTIARAVASGRDSRNVQICRRSGDTSFFALEYDPRRYAPIWVSYRIANTFGVGGCASMTRRQMQCHFKADDVEACIKSKDGVSDPFHTDSLLAKKIVPRLSVGDFSGTGHDRGHVAPNNAFSWHACGAYKTFTMANMTAQWGSLNRALWANLEAQVLYWGVKDGPIHVVTGPIWSSFPSDRFQAIQDGLVNPDSFPKPGERLTRLNGNALSKNIPRPTGFFTVVYKAGTGQSGNAIAFLVPHTKQEKLPFWYFVSTVELVEEVSGLRFGFPDEHKGWPDLSYWRAAEREAPSGWDLRGGCASRLPVAGWMANRSAAERIVICASSAPAH